MTSERENNFGEIDNGLLKMRSFNIVGNDIDAFYDSEKNLVFVLDKTVNSDKPNVLLVMNPVADKKWDEILSGQYKIDLETIRPKVDNKYQKLDIEYSGLSVYDNLINAYVSGAGLEEHLIQLGILRDSAVRHSAMMRLDTANEIISKTNMTIVKTKETIVRLQERLKTLRNKLADQKHEIGRVSTKQSASKILKTESQIDATNEKLKQAKKRLESAQKRLEIATVDAELAGNLLNRKPFEINNKPMAVAVKQDVKTVEPATEEYSVEEPEIEGNGDYTMDDTEEKIIPEDDSDDESKENEIKPLLEEDPQIINDEIAFKPISFEPNGFDANELPVPATEPELPAPAPSDEDFSNNDDKDDLQNDDLETDYTEYKDDDDMSEKTEISFEPVVPETDTDLPVVEEKPVLDSIVPVPENFDDVAKEEKDLEQPDFSNVYDNNLDTVVNSSNDDYSLDDVVDTDSPIEKHDDYVDTPVAPNTDTLIRPMPAFVPAPADSVTDQPVIPVEDVNKNRKSSLLYYLLLIVLIIISVITLWLYQKHMGNGKFNWFSTGTSEQIVEPGDIDDVPVSEPIDDGNDFVEQPESVQPTPSVPEDTEQSESKVQESAEPIIFGGVPANVSAFGSFAQQQESQQTDVVNTVVDKPVYSTDSKYDDMFVYEEDQEPGEYVIEQDAPMVIVDEVYDDYVEYPNEYVEEYVEEFVDGNSVAYVDDDTLIIVDDEPDTDSENTTASNAVSDAGANQESRIIYNGDDIYAPDAGYQDDFYYDIEEDEYQSGDDGYGQY